MTRKEDGKTIQFKVFDNVSKLNRENWDRVVAVFEPETTITTTTTTDCDREAFEGRRPKRCTHPQSPATTVYSLW